MDACLGNLVALLPIIHYQNAGIVLAEFNLAGPCPCTIPLLPPPTRADQQRKSKLLPAHNRQNQAHKERAGMRNQADRGELI